MVTKLTPQPIVGQLRSHVCSPSSACRNILTDQMIYFYLVRVHVLYYLPRYTTLAIAHANSMQVPPNVAHICKII